MIVFTNGCFDLLHPGHIELLRQAKALGSRLVVGINSDRSVRAIKGPSRPYLPQEDRKVILEALESVDEVVIFDELTPERLIKELSPDVLVKGGDWKEDEIIGSDHVKNSGGKVVSIPLVGGHSSTNIARKFVDDASTEKGEDGLVERSLAEHRSVLERIDDQMIQSFHECSDLIIATLKAGGKLLICGNGGSAADAQHIAAEFVGRYETERIGLPAIALTTDTSALTAIGNDFGFKRVYARQVEALANSGDCLVAISTSGESESIIAAVMSARAKGCKVIGMTGARGKKLASLCDLVLMIPSERTARIQEMHITIAHILCELTDEAFTENDH